MTDAQLLSLSCKRQRPPPVAASCESATKLRRTLGGQRKAAELKLELVETEGERATLQHRDEIVAALLTIASALGLTRETLHLCVDVLDRFLDRRRVAAARLETLGIAYAARTCGS